MAPFGCGSYPLASGGVGRDNVATPASEEVLAVTAFACEGFDGHEAMAGSVTGPPKL